MSTSDPNTPITPTAPRTPSFASIPSLLIRTVSQRTNTTTHRRNSSIVSVPPSPMDTTFPASSWQRRETVKENTLMTSSPVLDRAPLNVFTSMRENIQQPPLHYRITVTPANQPYAAALQHIQSPLNPLISVTSGQSHPSFPTSLLQYHLLTHPELDDLSIHYHQTEPPTENSWRYPCQVPGWVPACNVNVTAEQSTRPAVTLDTKRRRFGRFIGLRDCESPSLLEGQLEMEVRMEREWKKQLESRREEERLKEKNWSGSW